MDTIQCRGLESTFDTPTSPGVSVFVRPAPKHVCIVSQLGGHSAWIATQRRQKNMNEVKAEKAKHRHAWEVIGQFDTEELVQVLVQCAICGACKVRATPRAIPEVMT